MSTRPIVNDALWRCLCPSFAPSGSACRSFLPPQSRIALRNGPTTGGPRRSLFVTTRRRSYNALNSDALHQPISSSHGGSHPPRPPSFRRNAKQDSPSLVLLPTVELYERLRRDAAAGRTDEVMNIVKILIKDRRERPNVRLYAGVLHSFVNPEDGTAGKIRKVLEEMAEMGIDLDAGACHAVLEALAVHPDYLLREEILAYMKERWFSLTDRGHNMVAAGLLRDRLFEQAVQKIEDMLHQSVIVADWLLDKAIWIMLDYGEIDEAWQLLQIRQQSGRTTLSQPLWVQFLDVAGKLCHVEAVSQLWSTRVIPGYLKPATTTCLNVLNLAARTGSVKLATDVFRVLAERNTLFTSHHYEMLLEAYLNADDLHAALSVLLIMTEAGIKVTEDSVSPLYVYLNRDHSRPLAAFSILQNFESTGRKVPTAGVNACLQAAVHLNRLSEAIEIYKLLHTVSRSGPNTQTFNILFQGCHKTGRKELAMFLAEEMVKLDITPNALTYDRLVLVCCHANDLHDAMLYYEEMRAQGYVPRRGTFEILIEKGVKEGDERVKLVLEDMRACGSAPRREVVESVRRLVGERKTKSPTPVADAIAAGKGMEGLVKASADENGAFSQNMVAASSQDRLKVSVEVEGHEKDIRRAELDADRSK